MRAPAEAHRTRPYGLVLSHVLIDEIWRPGEDHATEALGGAGIHACLGQALAFQHQGVSVPVSGVGVDFPSVYREQLRASDVDDSGLVAVDEATPRNVVRYQSEQIRTETPAFGLDHFKKSDPQISFVPANRKEPQTTYIFAGVNEPAWDVIDRVSGPVLWELHDLFCLPEYASQIRRRAENVDVVSLNEEELHSLVGGSAMSHLRLAIDELFVGVAAVALRRGERGAVLVCGNDVFEAVPRSTGPVVDPTGAGNAFCGALSVVWAQQPNEPAQALQAAMAAAAVTLTVEGPTLPITEAMREQFALVAASQHVDRYRFDLTD